MIFNQDIGVLDNTSPVSGLYIMYRKASMPDLDGMVIGRVVPDTDLAGYPIK